MEFWKLYYEIKNTLHSLWLYTSSDSYQHLLNSFVERPLENTGISENTKYVKC